MSFGFHSAWRWSGLLLLAILLTSLSIRWLLEPADGTREAPPAGPPTTPVTAEVKSQTPEWLTPETIQPTPLPIPPAATPAETLKPGTPLIAPVPKMSPNKHIQTPSPAPNVPSPITSGPEANRRWIEDLHARMATDFSNALTYCQSLPADKQPMAFRMLFSEWAQKDPESALRAAQGLSSDWQQAMVILTLRAWMNSNPEVALARMASVSGLPEASVKHLASQAMAEIGRRDPTTALSLLATSTLVDAARREQITANILRRWLATDTRTALEWMRNSNLDERTYDRSIVEAVGQMSGAQGVGAVALFTEFVTAGRMDKIADPAIYSQAVWAAKSLGAISGGRDYSAAVEWGFQLPEESTAQAYVLSNVAFSQTHGPALPDMPWIAEMKPGFTKTRTLAAVAYGRLLVAGGDAALSSEVKRQLDADALDTARIKVIVQQSALPSSEKRTILSLM